jgi:hypothetical protein
MQEITSQQIYKLEACMRDVLDENDQESDSAGRLAVLETWATNKLPLIEMLSKHPNWDDQQFGIRWTTTVCRESDLVLRQNRLLDFHELLTGYLHESLVSAVSNNESSDRRRDYMEQWQVIRRSLHNSNTLYVTANDLPPSIAVKGKIDGMKWSRFISKWSLETGFSKCKGYNNLYARLSNSLNPRCNICTAVLSVNPMDYLLMSKGNSWSSCHKIHDGGGEYCSGTISYMLDAVSMIFYTLHEDIVDPAKIVWGADGGASTTLYSKPKLTRQVFCYNDGTLLQSRYYPDEDDDAGIKQNRLAVEDAIAECLGRVSVWCVVKPDDQDVYSDYVFARGGATHYADYQCLGNRPKLSHLKSSGIASIEIGHPPICIICGNTYDKTNSLTCCMSRLECTSCHYAHDEDDLYEIDGDLYCYDCTDTCGRCDDRVVSDALYAVIVNENDTHSPESWCSNCVDYHAFRCEVCGDLFSNELLHEWNNGHDRLIDHLCPACFSERECDAAKESACQTESEPLTCAPA